MFYPLQSHTHTLPSELASGHSRQLGNLTGVRPLNVFCTVLTLLLFCVCIVLLLEACQSIKEGKRCWVFISTRDAPPLSNIRLVDFSHFFIQSVVTNNILREESIFWIIRYKSPPPCLLYASLIFQPFFSFTSFHFLWTLILHISNIQCLPLLSIGFCEYGYFAQPLILLLFLDPHSILTITDLHIYLLDQICFRIIFKSPSTSKLWRKICNLIWDSKEGINSLKMKLNTLERSRFISCLWFDLFHWRQINFWALTWCCRITAEKKIDWTLVPCTALMLYFDTVCSKLYNTLVLLFNGSSVRYTAVL